MSETILIIEDELDLVQVLEYNLRKEGFTVQSALNGADALAIIEAQVPDLVLLDLMLPDISGTEICRTLRSDERTAAVPVLMLTAKGEEIDRIVGFEVGADDYVTKPFSIRELLLRIRANLRRHNRPEGSRVCHGLLEVNKDEHRVRVRGQDVVLTALEFRLIDVFLSRKGRVQTRDMLLSDVWDIHADVTTRTVDTHVKRLREKLGEAGTYIETVRGVGYRMKAQLEEAR